MTATDGRILAVLAPSDTYGHSYSKHRNHVSAHQLNEPFGDVDWFSDKLPPGNWRIIGLHSQDKPMSEEDASKLVEDANDQIFDVGNIGHYKDYESESWEDDYPTAIESLESWCREHEVYFDNIYLRPEYSALASSRKPFDAITEYNRLLRQFNEAESRTGTWIFLLNE